MATTTNYGWTTPDDTALVKDGAAAIRSLGTAIDTTTYNNAQAAIAKTIVDAKGDIVAASAADTPARLAVGTDNQRLVAASGEATGLKYVGDTQNTVIDAKGDLLVGSAADTLARLAVGTNDYVLTADSTATNGIKWAAVATGSTFVGCVLVNTGSQSISHNTNTIITFASEEIDTDGFHDTSSNTGRITIPTGKNGKYLIFGRTIWAAGASSNSRIQYLYKNGAELGATQRINYDQIGSMSSTFVVDCVATDYLELRVYHDQGVSKNVNESSFGAVYLGA